MYPFLYIRACTGIGSWQLRISGVIAANYQALHWVLVDLANYQACIGGLLVVGPDTYSQAV